MGRRPSSRASGRGVSAFPRPHVQPAAGCGLRQAPRTVRTTTMEMGRGRADGACVRHLPGDERTRGGAAPARARVTPQGRTGQVRSFRLLRCMLIITMVVHSCYVIRELWCLKERRRFNCLVAVRRRRYACISTAHLVRDCELRRTVGVRGPRNPGLSGPTGAVFSGLSSLSCSLLESQNRVIKLLESNST